MKNKKLCVDCNKEIFKTSIRCKSCYHAFAKLNDLHKGINNGMFGRTGKKNPNHKDGRTLKKYYCTICKIVEISWRQAIYTRRNPVCLSCSRKGKNNNMFGKIAHHGRGCYYNSVWMRSSYEYKFAWWCDSLNIDWKYEPKAFNLGETTYRPDFYLPEFNLYIEIKGYWRDDAEKKFNLFKQIYCGERIRVVDKIELKKMGIL